jgi:hypothetical protein
VFDIRFTTSEPEVQEDGWLGLWGETVLRDYRERFLAPLGPWSRGDYERQWIEAAGRLLGSEARAGFFTTAFQFWWVMWREGERIFVQEEFLTPERLEGLTDPGRAPYHLIAERVTESEDGEEVSQWEIGASEVQAFLSRRSGQYLSSRADR